jgi:hypothetical protein
VTSSLSGKESPAEPMEGFAAGLRYGHSLPQIIHNVHLQVAVEFLAQHPLHSLFAK